MNKQSKIKIGVIGTGHLGNFHIEQLLKIEDAVLVGFMMFLGLMPKLPQKNTT